jgi:hypothetical protein
MAQVVEHLLCKCKALSSNSRPIKKINKIIKHCSIPGNKYLFLKFIYLFYFFNLTFKNRSPLKNLAIGTICSIDPPKLQDLLKDKNPQFKESTTSEAGMTRTLHLIC